MSLSKARKTDHNPPASGTRWAQLIPLSRDGGIPLQSQLRSGILRAITAHALRPGMRLPATRELADTLGLARNTVILAYRKLADDGWLQADGRHGHRVSAAAAAARDPASRGGVGAARGIDWHRRLGGGAQAMPQVPKPRDALAYPYPFIYGEFDPTGFPLRAWREVSRLALRPQAVRSWASDRIDADDPELLEQIAQRVLPRRGIRVSTDRILVTLGAQQAIALVAAALGRGGATVGLESPGYPDAWNTWAMAGARTLALPLDDSGLRPGSALARCSVVQVSPSHQNPTTVTMPPARRRLLMEAAVRHDLILVEDDYDSELAFDGGSHAAIKAMDEDERVVYVGSLSKTLAPGLRLGFMVAAPPLIAEARAIRRLMVRHPPTNNQRALASFVALGHYDAGVRRLVTVYRERAQILVESLRRHLPALHFEEPTGGSSLWAVAPQGVDTSLLAAQARQRGVLFDAGAVFWRGTRAAPSNGLRLGYASIDAARIDMGVRELAKAFAEIRLAKPVDSRNPRR